MASGRAELCRRHDLWLLYWGGFEGVVYDDRSVRQPSACPACGRGRSPSGAPTMEQRMIAWRVRWLVFPAELSDAISQAQIYNGLVASGFAQIGTREALRVGDHDLLAANAEWERRRDEMLRQLEGLPVVKPSGAWAALLDVAALGFGCDEASARLLDQKVAATQVRGWGRRGRRPPRAIRVQQRADGANRPPRPPSARRAGVVTTPQGQLPRNRRRGVRRGEVAANALAGIRSPKTTGKGRTR